MSEHETATHTSTIQPIWKIKHPASCGLHLLGFGAATVATVVRILHGPDAVPTLRLVCLYIFLVSMAFLYLSSSLYHLLNVSDVVTRRLRKLDHSMIYVFIAGTITPFCLSFPSMRARIVAIAFTWALAFSGAFSTSLLANRSRWTRVGAYIALSAFGLIAIAAGFRRFDHQVLIWLFSGCAVYVIGSIVYATKVPDPFPKHFGFHEIWHLFVLLGCTCHYFAVEAFLRLPLV